MHWTTSTPAGRSGRLPADLDQGRIATDDAPEPALDERRAVDPAVDEDAVIAEDRPDEDGPRSIPRLRRADRA